MSADLSPDEIARSHRWHAIECNNLAWRLSDQPERTISESEEMLHAAHASAFHWAMAGTERNTARAKLLLGHVYAALGDGPTAQRYAQQSCTYLMAHDPPDWEMAFAEAILAHAAFAARDPALHREHYTRARELGDAIADPEDREIFFKTYDRIPRP
jgi:hypothetical protein